MILRGPKVLNSHGSLIRGGLDLFYGKEGQTENENALYYKPLKPF